MITVAQPDVPVATIETALFVNTGVKELRELEQLWEDVVAMHAGELRTHTSGHLKGNNNALFVPSQVFADFIVFDKLSMCASVKARLGSLWI